MNYPIYIFFGLAPSVIWLLFYLRKDVHPESNKMILKIFLYGMIIAVIAAFVEISISESFFVMNDKEIESYSFLYFLLYNFSLDFNASFWRKNKGVIFSLWDNEPEYNYFPRSFLLLDAKNCIIYNYSLGLPHSGKLYWRRISV